MYILLFIVVLLVILFIMKSNVQVETFKNIGKKVFSQVRRVDFRKNNMSRTTFIYTITIVLWLITIISLKMKINRGEIAGWMDLFYI